MEIHHAFIGNPEAKKLIIFLHEGLGSIQQWKKFPEELCAQTNAYGFVYDRSGYGKSPGVLLNRKADYLHLAAEELSKVIETYIPDGYTIFLYGHSDGGSIALLYSAKNKHDIKAIITEAAHVFVEKETLIGVAAALPPFQAGKFDGLKKYHGDRFKEVFIAWSSIWLAPEFKNWNISNVLADIKIPQLIIQGKMDQYGTLKQVEMIASHTTGHSTIFTPEKCGHAPHKEIRKETLLKVSNFINEH